MVGGGGIEKPKAIETNPVRRLARLTGGEERGMHDMYFDESWKEYAVLPSLAGLFTSDLVNSIIFVLNFASSLKSQHSSQISVLVNAFRLYGSWGGILEDGGS